MLKAIWRSRAVQQTLGSGLAGYLRLVRRTNRCITEHADDYARFAGLEPVILAMWHGQHFMIPVMKLDSQKFNVMISRHGDGELNAIAVEKLGFGLIRGSGAQRKDQIRKRGGVRALLAMLKVLEAGENVAMTADVPKVSRVCGKGIILLAKMSGRPIVPVAVCCSRRIDLKSWDATSIGLPFGTTSLVIGEAMPVAADADEAALEAHRVALEAAMDDVHRRGYGLFGQRDPGGDRPSVLEARARMAAGALP